MTQPPDRLCSISHHNWSNTSHRLCPCNRSVIISSSQNNNPQSDMISDILDVHKYSMQYHLSYRTLIQAKLDAGDKDHVQQT